MAITTRKQGWKNIKFISQYINIQIGQINKGIDIIRSNQTINTPTNEQIKIAKEWCLKYGIEINDNCYYINGQSEQVDFKMGLEWVSFIFLDG